MQGMQACYMNSTQMAPPFQLFLENLEYSMPEAILKKSNVKFHLFICYKIIINIS